MNRPITATVLAALLALVLLPTRAEAHCDAMEGPVVTEARQALKAGEVTPVLKWVSADQEAAVREAFKKTLKVRKQSDTAREVADHHFFETLVRLHRASEGEPFTGIKPGKGDPDPAVLAADRALEQGDGAQLAKKVAAAVERAILTRYERSKEAWKHADESVEKGREAVHAYVDYVHFVKNVHQTAAGGGGHGHGGETAERGAENAHGQARARAEAHGAH